MIINFTVRNFGCIKDAQTLSFEANKSKHLEESYIININGLRLLKLALIFGPNASGKTTILKALDFLRDLVLSPINLKTKELEFEPFLFDSETQKQSSFMSIEFLANSKRFLYEIEFSKKAILNEKLYFLNSRKKYIFRRSTDLEKQLTKIEFNKSIKITEAELNALQANTLINNTVLGGTVKTNVYVEELKMVIDWFNNYSLILPITDLTGFIMPKIEKKEIRKELIINILKNADYNISDISFKKIKIEKLNDFIIFIASKRIMDIGEELMKIDKDFNISKLELTHNVNNANYNLPFEYESAGTQRYFGIAGFLSLAKIKSSILLIDELESSLHPDLIIHFLLSFIVNSKQSQIIATTHFREILAIKDIFRPDVIWFTQKDEHQATELYSLADFNTKVIRMDTSNILSAYQSGKLGAVPNLGDYFID